MQFASLLTQIDTLVNDSSFGDSDLIQGATNNLTIIFNENSTSTLTASAIDSPPGTAGINIAVEGNNFLNGSGIITGLTTVSNAVTTLWTTSATLTSNATSLQTGLQFAQQLANMSTGGAGKQTLADMNAENANFLVLQTPQRLGINSLSLAVPERTINSSPRQ